MRVLTAAITVSPSRRQAAARTSSREARTSGRASRDSRWGVRAWTSWAARPAAAQAAGDLGKPLSPWRMKYCTPVAPSTRASHVIRRSSRAVGSRVQCSPPPKAWPTSHRGVRTPSPPTAAATAGPTLAAGAFGTG